METLFSTISTIITNIMDLFINVSSSLLENTIFQLLIGVIILSIVIGLVFTLIKKLKKNKHYSNNDLINLIDDVRNDNSYVGKLSAAYNRKAQRKKYIKFFIRKFNKNYGVKEL